MSESLTSEMEKLDVQGKQSNSCLRTHVLKGMAKNNDMPYGSE